MNPFELRRLQEKRQRAATEERLRAEKEYARETSQNSTSDSNRVNELALKYAVSSMGEDTQKLFAEWAETSNRKNDLNPLEFKQDISSMDDQAKKLYAKLAGVDPKYERRFLKGVDIDYYNDAIEELDQQIKNIENEDVRGEKGQKRFADKQEEIKKLKDEQDRIEAARRIYEHENYFDLNYAAQLNNDDFEEFSKKGAAIQNPTTEEFDTGTNKNIENKLSFYLVNKDKAVDYSNAGEGQWEKILQQGERNNWSYLTEKERAFYNYTLAKRGGDAADNFLESMQTILDKRANDEYEDQLRSVIDLGGIGAVAANIASVPANVYGGATGFIDDAFRTITGQEINPYSPAHGLTNFSGAVRDETASNIAESNKLNLFGTNIPAFLYQTLMSVADSTLGAATLGNGYTVFMGAGAATNEAKRLYEQGASNTQILGGSLAAGIAEALFEKVSLDRLLNPREIKSIGALTKSILTQAGVEASEEVFTEIANTISNSIIMGANSDLSNDINAYLQQGLTEDEAKKKALISKVADIAWAGVGGAISGGVMGGAVDTYNLSAQNARTGSEIKQNGGTQILTQAVLDNREGYGDRLYKLAQKVAAGKTADATVGKLYNRAENALIKKDAAGTKSAIQERLHELGVEGADAETAAEGIFKNFVGRQMNRKETKLFQANENVKKVWVELTSPNNRQINSEDNATRSYETPQRSALYNEVSARFDTEAKKLADAARGLRPQAEGIESSRTNASVNRDTGEPVTIKEDHPVAAISENGITLNTSAGEMDSAELRLQDDYAALLSYGKKYRMNAEEINSMIAGYSADTDADVYARGYISAYNDARMGYDLSSTRARISEYFTGHSIDEQILAEAWEAGNTRRVDTLRKKERQNRQTVETGKSRNGGTIRVRKGKTELHTGVYHLSEQQEAGLQLVKTLSEATGIDFIVYNSMVEKQYKDFNGRYIKKNGQAEIWLDLSVDQFGESAMLATLSHELTHFIAEQSPAAYEKYKNFLFHELNQYDEETVAGLVEQKKKAYARLSDEALAEKVALEEVVASCSEQMLKDGSAIKRLAKTDLSTFRKIKAYIDEFLEKLIAAFKNMHGLQDALLESVNADIAELQRLWNDALADAVETYNAERMELGGKSARNKKGSPAAGKSAQVQEQSSIPFVASTINIAGLPKIVNNTHQSILSDDVLEHLNEARDKKGTYTDKVLFRTNTKDEGGGYIENNKKRVNDWEKRTGLYLPVGDSNTNSNNRISQDHSSVNTHSMQGDEINSGKNDPDHKLADGIKFRLNPEFESQYDAWDKKKARFSFLLGQTSEALQSIGVRKADIRWDATKILKIQEKHPAMTDPVIKQVPHILEQPILIMRSKTVEGRLTLFGEINDAKGNPVLAVLELNPSFKNTKTLDIIKVASAYGKDVALQKFIDTSVILFVDKKRADSWLNLNRLKLPLGNQLDSNNRISQDHSSVNTHSMQEGEKDSAQRETTDRPAALRQSAIRHFGQTENWNEAGYLLTTGEWLDFSGKNNGKRGGRRNLDHSEIIEAYTGEEQDRLDGEAAVIDFMRQGNIRLMPESNAINLCAVPTDAQEEALRSYLSTLEGNIYLDIDDQQGGLAVSESYPAGTKADRILRDIRKYFKDGTRPLVSGLSEFMYSLRDYSYESLIAKPDMKVILIDGKVPENRADIVQSAKKNAAAIGEKRKDGSVSVYVKDMNAAVILGTEGLKHGLDRRLEVNGSVTLKAGEILQNSIKINELTPNKTDASRSFVLIGCAGNKDGDLYIVRSVINRFRSELVSMDVLYALNAKKEEPAALNAPRFTAKPLSVTGSTISITDSQDFVNTKKEPASLKDTWLTDQTAAHTDSNTSITNPPDSVNTKKEPGALLPGFTSKPAIPSGSNTSITNSPDTVNTDSTIRIADLLDYVNRYFPDILPESVLRHYGYEARPAGKLGESALYALRWDTDRAVLAAQLSENAETDAEKRRLADYRRAIKRMQEKVSALSKVHDALRQDFEGTGAERRERTENLIARQKKLEGSINWWHNRLTELEQEQPLQDILRRAQKKSVEQAKQKGREMVREYRKEYRDKQTKKALRAKIKRTISELTHLLAHGNKKKNIKAGVQNTVAAALAYGELLFGDKITNEDIVRAGVTNTTPEESALLNRYSDLLYQRDALSDQIEKALQASTKDYKPNIARLEEELRRVNAGITELNGKLRNVFERTRIAYNNTDAATLLDDLSRSYSDLQNAEESYIADAYDPFVEERLSVFKTSLEGTTINSMNEAQLQELCDAFTMVRTLVKQTDTLFRNGKRERVSEMGNAVMAEVAAYSRENRFKSAAARKVIDFSTDKIWKDAKPVYAFEQIGSPTLMKLFRDNIGAEEVYARDIIEAGERIREAKRKYGYSTWELNTTHSFKLAGGDILHIKSAQIMCLYALAQRVQALKHLLGGGISFEHGDSYKLAKKFLKQAREIGKLYRLTPEIIERITGTLTTDQKAYVDDMQQFVTETLGGKGNEVSRALYGIDIFTEEIYFKIESRETFISIGKQADSKNRTPTSLKNSATAKETVPNANNPIIIRDFDDVLLDSVEQMAKYHALVLPIENMNRVLNYKTVDQEGNHISVLSEIERVHGKAAVDYIRKYILDLNGGVIVEKDPGPFSSMFSKAKKSWVGAAVSVAVQQPTAVLRAMSMINPEYFGLGRSKKIDGMERMKLYDEMKKHAPIVVIKEMGGFDVGSSRRLKDYIGVTEYEGFNKVRALKKDKDYRRTTADRAFMYFSEKADELGWTVIWSAVKREVAATQDYTVGSEDYFAACGKRFTEVIVYTQVYDSVNSRSGFMRSDNDLAKAATAFMGEPTTDINMLAHALVQFTRAPKGEKGRAAAQFARTVGSILASKALAAAAAAVIYAMRDDDDEKEFWEKYRDHFTDKFTSEIFLVNMLPYIRDIASIWQGWTVERPDLSIISDVIYATKKLLKDDVSTYEKLEDFVGGIAALFGIPAKNLMRDTRGIFYTAKSFFEDPTATVNNFKAGSVAENKAQINAMMEAAKTKALANIEEKIADGRLKPMTEAQKKKEAEKNAKSSVRSSFTKRYREEYFQAWQARDVDAIARIRKTLLATKLYDDVDDTLREWRKDWVRTK